jgi:hypothetical protein
VQSEFLLLVVMPTSALRKALLMISDVPRWYGRETVALCLVGAVVMVGGDLVCGLGGGGIGVWVGGWWGWWVGVGWGDCSA